jgi:hypothetical protein
MKPTPAAAWAATRMGSTLQQRWTAAPVGAGEHEDSPRRGPPGRASASGDLTAVLALYGERRPEGGAHADA